MRSAIKLKLIDPEAFKTKSKAYQIVEQALTKMGGREFYIDRGALIGEVEVELELTGDAMKNLDATVSSFCALPGVHAVREAGEGEFEDLVTARIAATKKKAPEAEAAEAN